MFVKEITMFLSKSKIKLLALLLIPAFLNAKAEKKVTPQKTQKKETTTNVEKKIQQLEKEIVKKKNELFDLENELNKLKQKKPAPTKKGEVFYDLGSGLGKLPLHAVLHDPKNPDEAVKTIEEYFKDIRAEIPDAEREMVTRGKGSPVYGEIIPESFKKVLMDEGLNVGNIVKAVGIELSPTRHHHAVTIKNKLESDNKLPKDKEIDFRNENMLESDISDATLVYLGSTCYPDELMDKLVELLSKQKEGLRVVTLKELPDHEKFGFRKIKEVKLPMTWSSASPEHFYILEKSKKAAAKPAPKKEIKKAEPVATQEFEEAQEEVTKPVSFQAPGGAPFADEDEDTDEEK